MSQRYSVGVARNQGRVVLKGLQDLIRLVQCMTAEENRDLVRVMA